MAVVATFVNQAIPQGVFTSPAAAVAADVRGLSLRMSRNNWPAAGVTIALLLSFDGGNTFPKSDAVSIAAWVNDGTGKHPLSDAVIGWGWNTAQPTHVKAQTTSPQAFSTTITIESL